MRINITQGIIKGGAGLMGGRIAAIIGKCVKYISGIWTALLDSLFPVRCISCGRPDGGKIFCERCQALLESESLNRHCKLCKKTPNLCNCRKILHIDAVFYKYLYIGVAKRAIRRYKKENLYYINEFFSKELFTLVEKNDRINMGEVDLISNVPRKGRAIRDFGYDQTKNIAKKVADFSGIQYKAVLRVAENYAEQKGLNSKERKLNVRNKFTPVKKSLVAGKNILLIDDIVTTGSTLSECARALKNTGAKKIYALCIASSEFQYSRVKSESKNLLQL